MRSIEISVKKRVGRLFYDGVRVSDGRWMLDTRKVRVHVRQQCALAEWVNDRITRSLPFAIQGGKHSKDPLPMPNLQRTFKDKLKYTTRPVVYEGVYRSPDGGVYTSLDGSACAILKPANSSWRVVLSMKYFKLFDDAGFYFESPLPAKYGVGRCVIHPVRMVTERGALCGLLQPMSLGVDMAALRERVIKDADRKAA